MKKSKKKTRALRPRSKEAQRHAVEKARVGAPPKYLNKQDMGVKIAEYFKDWDDPDRKNPYTPVGLRVHLGLVDTSFREYQAKEEFALILKTAMDMIQSDLTTRALRQRISPVAWIFLMKNVFGWADRQDVQNTLTLDVGDKLRDALKGVSQSETKVIEQQGGSEG